MATLGEAEIFADAGLDEVFVAYPLWTDPQRAPRLRALAARIRLMTGVDSLASVHQLAAAVQGHAELRVLVEVDCGLRRSGVARPTARAGSRPRRPGRAWRWTACSPSPGTATRRACPPRPRPTRRPRWPPRRPAWRRPGCPARCAAAGPRPCRRRSGTSRHRAARPQAAQAAAARRPGHRTAARGVRVQRRTAGRPGQLHAGRGGAVRAGHRGQHAGAGPLRAGLRGQGARLRPPGVGAGARAAARVPGRHGHRRVGAPRGGGHRGRARGRPWATGSS